MIWTDQVRSESDQRSSLSGHGTHGSLLEKPSHIHRGRQIHVVFPEQSLFDVLHIAPLEDPSKTGEHRRA